MGKIKQLSIYNGGWTGPHDFGADAGNIDYPISNTTNTTPLTEIIGSVTGNESDSVLGRLDALESSEQSAVAVDGDISSTILNTVISNNTYPTSGAYLDSVLMPNRIREDSSEYQSTDTQAVLWEKFNAFRNRVASQLMEIGMPRLLNSFTATGIPAAEADFTSIGTITINRPGKYLLSTVATAYKTNESSWSYSIKFEFLDDTSSGNLIATSGALVIGEQTTGKPHVNAGAITNTSHLHDETYIYIKGPVSLQVKVWASNGLDSVTTTTTGIFLGDYFTDITWKEGTTIPTEWSDTPLDISDYYPDLSSTTEETSDETTENTEEETT